VLFEGVPLPQLPHLLHIGIRVRRDDRETIPQVWEEPVEWSQDILQSKSVDRCNIIVSVFVSKASLSQPTIYLIRGGIGVRDAGDASGGAFHQFDAIYELRDDNSRLPAAGTRHETNMARFGHGGTLFVS
jgi:hypothetical protein